MRAFTAVDIEKKQLLKKLKDIQKEINYNFNTVKPEKMHITLQFFRQINEEESQKIQKAMENISLKPFQIQIKGIGVFPSRDHVRVVWAGIESQEIHRLKEQASNHPVKDDNDHEFQPHITLMRVDHIRRRNKKQFRKKLEKLENQKVGETKVNSIKLFESRHNGQDTNYNLIKEKNLKK